MFFVLEQYLDEASFETHISADYGLIFNQQLGSLIEEDESQLTWLTRFDPP
jgi:quinol monooxygenase YgiN